MVTSAAHLVAATGERAKAASDTEFDAAFWPLFLTAFRAAHRILGDRHAAEDVAADALARAHVHWRRIAGRPYRDAWVVRVATNRALDLHRRGRLSVSMPPSVGFDEGVAVRVSLLQALHELPRRQREVVVLRFLVGLPVGDVAAVLGIGPGSVRTHLERGLRSLRAHLGDDYGRSW
jgi:DNA-directed RNA polymerase specialized sigma24 family protein